MEPNSNMTKAALTTIFRQAVDTIAYLEARRRKALLALQAKAAKDKPKPPTP